MRTCLCGCGRSLEGMSNRALRHPRCPSSTQAAYASRFRERQRCKSVCKQQHHVTKSVDEPPREPQPKCPVCAGMPEARTPMRSDCNGFAIAFEVDGIWRCYRCWERYAPERPRRIVGVIGSSAGTAAAHGVLYGAQIKRFA